MPSPLRKEPPPRRGRKEDTRQGKKQVNVNKKEEEAKKALTELWDHYADLLHPFVDTDLIEDQWRKFCELVHTLPGDLKEIMGKFGQRRGNPTHNWRRRQQRKARKKDSNNNNREKPNGKEKEKGDDWKPREDDSRKWKDNRRPGEKFNNRKNEDHRKKLATEDPATITGPTAGGEMIGETTGTITRRDLAD